MSHAVELKEEQTRIGPSHPWNRAWQPFALIGLIGVVLSAVAWNEDPKRFAFAWLFALLACLTVPLGGLFFVFVSFLTAANWSVSVRRLAEFLAMGVPVLALLFIPVWIERDEPYEWTHSAHGEGHGASGHGDGHAAVSGDAAGGDALSEVLGSTASAQDHPSLPPGHPPGPAHDGEAHTDHGHDQGHGDHGAAHGGPLHTPQQTALHHELLEHKSPWLNDGRVGVFALIYFLIWIGLAWFYFRSSTLQDHSKDPRHTVLMQRFAPLTGILFALTLTFAGFDWVMSLEPTWYSTIYGVYLFAGTAVTAYAVVIVLSLSLKSAGLLGEAVNVEHYHDLGKMLFGFVVFWTYIGASQLLLIWYANIPEETIYYYRRFHFAGWNQVSILLILGHFLFPFLYLMSNSIKRRLPLLQFGCSWLLLMHVVDIYWFVMPVATPGQLAPAWVDMTALLATFGSYFAVVLFLMRLYPLIAIGDPRLPRALAHSQ